VVAFLPPSAQMTKRGFWSWLAKRAKEQLTKPPSALTVGYGLFLAGFFMLFYALFGLLLGELARGTAQLICVSALPLFGLALLLMLYDWYLLEKR